eukprot:TRINITY_DN4276_c0_g2_i2.p1 TRINITY_DN4276_c0_g2~~TRINITY_DN4276_c0_g2_i2.p1  ORF type:complete len:200 (+),score=38.56 TRINITY_DN4276_c0_g2_i2:54-653(+)
MAIFTAQRLEAHEKVASKVRDNPYFPFTQVDQNQFRYTIRYRRYVWGIYGFLLMIMLIILMVVFEQVNQFYFLFPVGIAIACVNMIYQYKDVREYYLDGDSLRYQFKLRNQVIVEGHYHNVYVRLRRKVAASGGSLYYLILNGFQMDKIELSGTSKNIAAMREVGQKIAANLNINYFDEANISSFHVVRHFRPNDKIVD